MLKYIPRNLEKWYRRAFQEKKTAEDRILNLEIILLRFSTVVHCACAGGIKNLFFVLAILTVRLLFLGDFLFLSFEGLLSRGLKIRFFL